jgi:hypothetical protein
MMRALCRPTVQYSRFYSTVSLLVSSSDGLGMRCDMCDRCWMLDDAASITTILTLCLLVATSPLPLSLSAVSLLVLYTQLQAI